jgi:hypothetical protein
MTVIPVSFEQCPIDRGGAAILGEDRAVQVDSAVLGQSQSIFGKNLTVVAHDEQLGFPSENSFVNFRLIYVVGRVSFYSMFFARIAHGVGRRFATSARRRSGSSNERNDIVLTLQQ